MSKHAIARWGSALVAVAIGLFAWAPSASAHYGEVTATAACAGTVSFTSTSWMPESELGENAHIDIWWSVEGGSTEIAPWSTDWYFGDGHWSFSGTLPATFEAGDVVTVYTVPMAPWGGDGIDGFNDEITVTVPSEDDCTPPPCEEIGTPEGESPSTDETTDDCATTTTTVGSTTTSTTVAPTTTTVPTGTRPTVRVGGETLTSTSTTGGIQVLAETQTAGGVLAFTGSTTGPLTALAIVLVAAGGGLLVIANRRQRSELS